MICTRVSFSSHWNFFKCWQIEEVSGCDELCRENIPLLRHIGAVAALMCVQDSEKLEQTQNCMFIFYDGFHVINSSASDIHIKLVVLE